MGKKTIIITGDSREIEKVLRENSRRVAVGVITISEKDSAQAPNKPTEDTDTKHQDVNPAPKQAGRPKADTKK